MRTCLVIHLKAMVILPRKRETFPKTWAGTNKPDKPYATYTSGTSLLFTQQNIFQNTFQNISAILAVYANVRIL